MTYMTMLTKYAHWHMRPPVGHSSVGCEGRRHGKESVRVV